MRIVLRGRCWDRSDSLKAFLLTLKQANSGFFLFNGFRFGYSFSYFNVFESNSGVNDFYLDFISIHYLYIIYLFVIIHYILLYILEN